MEGGGGFFGNFGRAIADRAGAIVDTTLNFGGRALGGVLDLPEAGPFFGQAPAGTVRLPQGPTISPATPGNRSQSLLGPVTGRSPRDAVGGLDSRESPGTDPSTGRVAVFGAPLSPVLIAGGIAAAVGLVLLLRR